MDNYFQIIFYLIIIFAFLNSIFKKKKKEESSQPPSISPGSQQRRTDASTQYQKRNEIQSDILKEIEGLFKGENTYSPGNRRIESDIEKEKMRRVPVEEHTEDKEWHTEDKEWHSEENEWHSEDEEWHEQSTKDHELEKSWHSITSYKRSASVDDTVAKEAEKFERMLAERNKVVPYPFNDLRKKLYSPQSLQDYIVVSEIIGKPKYLRR
jgi:hypothetical protein